MTAIGDDGEATKPFDLRIGPLGARAFDVVSVDGVEGISKLFTFDVVCLTDLEPVVFEATALGLPVTLTLRRHVGAARRVRGIVSAVRTLGTQLVAGHAPKHRFRIRIVPRMWILRRRKNSRIFQEMTLVEIIDAVLAEARVQHEWALTRSYPRRTYCLQYRETDYAFVTRLLAEEGIFFYFAAPESTGLDVADEALDVASAVARTADVGGTIDEAIGEKVVFADDAVRYPAIEDGLASEAANAAIAALEDAAPGSAKVQLPAPAIAYRPEEGMVAEDEHVGSFHFDRRLKSRAVVLRDYDFRRPMLRLNAAAGLDTANGPPSSAMPASSLPRSLAGGPSSLRGHAEAIADDAVERSAFDLRLLEIYEHHGEYEDPEVERDFARRILEQHRADARVGEGESTCRRFAAGHRFRLEGHADARFDREWTIAAVEHRGSIAAPGATQVGRTYRNRFRCVPADVAYRPKRRRANLQQVLESARVVGPPGEEIHTDEYGRIKVQFHWDREGRDNENSSCWIRTAHPWAGASFGFQFIPRVGSEVLVSFLGGDEDRPVIVGSVYNKTHPAPFPLPFSKSKSGIVTRSTPSALGSNEISFEDDRGNEHVLVRGERDLTLRAGRDAEIHVGHDRTTAIAGDDALSIRGARAAVVGGHESHSVGDAQTITVGGDRRVHVGGVASELVRGPASSSVDGSTILNRGNEIRTVCGFSSHSVGTEADESGLAVTVHGPEAHEVTKTISFRSDTAIRFEVGDSAIVVTPDRIHLLSKEIVANGTESLTLFGKGPAVQLTKQIDLTSKVINAYSKGASLTLDDDVKLAAPKIDLGTDPDGPPDPKDEAEKVDTKKFKWRMLDENRAPLKNKTYALVTQGLKKKGTTDGDGFIEVDVPKDAFAAEVDLWLDAYPTGRRQRHFVRLVELPPSNAPAGAAVRLRHLGYYAGASVDEVTDELARAIRNFQRDQQISESGELDGATATKLDEVHPPS